MYDRKFYTALRKDVIKLCEELRHVDIVLGIPCFANDASIQYVIQAAAEGLSKYFPGFKSLIFISDGGSTDDSREEARTANTVSFDVQTVVSIYRGVPGKGSALRAVFEAAKFLDARACCVVDADLRSITADWIRNLVTPVFQLGYDYVTPYYTRYKYDGTITNTIAYNLNRALYGKNIRQPIGGDFGISQRLLSHYLVQDVWETEIARFGVDIWMTTEAITGPFKVCQTKLGVKIHDEKDPTSHLGPMFTQVVNTIYTLMGLKENVWRTVTATEEVEYVGKEIRGEPKPFQIDLDKLREFFTLGFKNFNPMWKHILNPDSFQSLEAIVNNGLGKHRLSNEDWVKMVYDYAVAFAGTPMQRTTLLQTMIPLYNLRVAELVLDLQKTDRDDEVESYFDTIAADFMNLKSYLIERWDRMKEESRHG